MEKGGGGVSTTEKALINIAVALEKQRTEDMGGVSHTVKVWGMDEGMGKDFPIFITRYQI